MAAKYTDFVCVQYTDGDIVGKALAYASLLPHAIIVYHLSRFYSRREVHEALIVVGFVVNELVARTLKKLFKQPRPVAMCAQLDVCDSFGMPSAHTQCICFGLALHAVLCARGFQLKSLGTKALELVEVSALAVASIGTGLSRAYLGYHTPQQVAVGAGLGVVGGCLAYAVLDGCRQWYPIACQTTLGRVLCLKDTWCAADPLSLEAELWQSRAARKEDKQQ